MMNNCNFDNPIKLFQHHTKSHFNFKNLVKTHDVDPMLNFECDNSTNEIPPEMTMATYTNSHNNEEVFYYREHNLKERKENKKLRIMNEALRGAILAICGMVLTALALILTVIIFG